MVDEEALEQLAASAWQETARRLVAMIARRPGDLGAAGRSLMEALQTGGTLPRGVPALSNHFAERVPEGVRAELAAAIDWELHTYRGGRKVEVSHRLELLELGAIVPIELPAAQLGFDPDVSTQDLTAPHSMGDLARYANAYLGRTFVDDAIARGAPVELHNGTAAEAIAALRARGVTRVHQLATPKLHFQILLGDDGRYAIACDDGRDMFLHLQKALRAATTTGGRRVDPARVSRFDHHPDEAAYRLARFRRCFESSGPIPRQVTVGFKNALLGALEARATQLAAVRALQALPSLPSELEPLRAFDARELLCSAARRAWVAELFTRANVAELLRSRSVGPAKLVVVDGPDEFLDHSRLTYLDAEGERREVLLVRNPYGEAGVAMGTLFRECGVLDVLVYGTAASLDRGSAVGEVHLASRVTAPDGTVHEFENRALDEKFAGLHAQPTTRSRSRVVNVRSPLDEFDDDVERLRRDGHHLIEMELAGLLRGLAGGKTRVAALHVVSDVPQSAETLDGFSPTRAERALAAAVDVWVETFGIADLPLR